MATEIELARGYWKDVSISYEEALSRLPDELEKEGFGIITQIDLKETFKAKLGVDKAVVGAVDPMQTLGASGQGAGLADLARDVGARLERVLAALPS